ncbi:hypothetical protein A2701_01800 [Candidatus Amesbacteria bacterium RIFCSPHIGHO2_01_FULL_47_34]|nr:MAG: hypothetical protein A2701_01800 [Candidatus Amesbacteria bacterium RIFCSPHIGHO2_01_FULL_47_34]
MFLRETTNATPAVDEATLRNFLQQVVVYIRENPITVNNNWEQTSELLSKKPFLYVPCQVRAADNCPDQTSELPGCTNCPHAEASAEIFQKIGPSLGFEVHRHNEYPGLGTLSQTMRHNRSGDSMAFAIDGDDKGVATIHLNNMRRVAPPGK